MVKKDGWNISFTDEWPNSPDINELGVGNFRIYLTSSNEFSVVVCRIDHH